MPGRHLRSVIVGVCRLLRWTPGAIAPIALGVSFATVQAMVPPNDVCGAASIVTGLSWSGAGSTASAATDATDPTPQCGNGSRSQSVWYRFTAPPAGGTLTADTFGSDYDTILSAWSGACGQLTSWPNGCNDDYGSAQSRIDLAVPGGQTVLLMVSAYFKDGGNLVLNASFVAASGDVSGLVLAKTGASDLTLSWPPSCQAADTDYEIYEGSIGSFASHVPATCTTGGATSITLAPPLSSVYWLVVPRNTGREGSYGKDGAATERPPSAQACAPSFLAGCPPACAHDKCGAGVPLDTACDRGAAAVCAVDPYCCSFGWDAACVTEVRSAYGSLICPDSQGACAHALCQVGGSLTAACDDPPVDPSCVTAICTADAFCCTTAWDAVCVGEIASVCGQSCN